MDGPDRDGLVLAGVDASYGPRPVLRTVSLQAPAGLVTGLIGPNGSGKTTIIRVASRGLRPISGEVRIRGVDPYALTAREAARLVAVVPQEVAPAFEYTVHEMVSMGRSAYRRPWAGGVERDRPAIREAMGRTGVLHLAFRSIGELSGGERQRVILAQALAQEAPVVLLDEPTTHLDIRHVVETMVMVRALARGEGRAVMAIFHDLNLAAAISDRLYVLAEGRILASGTPEEILAPDLLAHVFGIEAEVRRSEMTGGLSVTVRAPVDPASDAMGHAGGARGGPEKIVHVVGGGGRGGAAMRALLDAGHDVTAGVLHQGDTDAEMAQQAGLVRVVVPPFSSIDSSSAEESLGLMQAAAAVVVVDAPFGPGNVENLRAALVAAMDGVALFLLDRVPVEGRDFTGGEATGLWRALGERGTVVRSVPELVGAIGMVQQTQGVPEPRSGR